MESIFARVRLLVKKDFIPFKKMCIKIVLMTLVFTVFAKPQDPIKDTIIISPQPIGKNINWPVNTIPPPSCVVSEWRLNYNAVVFQFPKIDLIINGELIHFTTNCQNWSGYQEGAVSGYLNDFQILMNTCYVNPVNPLPSVEIREITPTPSGFITYKEVWFHYPSIVCGGCKLDYNAGYIRTKFASSAGPNIYVDDPGIIEVTDDSKPVVSVNATSPDAVGPLEFIPTQSFATENLIDPSKGEFVIPENVDNMGYGYPDNKHVLNIKITIKARNACGFETEMDKWIQLYSPEHKILLGETKYFYVTYYSNTITETTNPDDIENVVPFATFDDLVVAPGSEKNPVYWDRLDKDGHELPDGMIRVIGRYWEDGKKFKAKLTAHYNYGDGEQLTSAFVEVKKPDVLGNTYNGTEAKDVFGNQIKINDFIIETAGKYGVPPQIIKGQILHETSFIPSYRYEPNMDISWQNKKDPDKNGGPSTHDRYFGSGKNFVVVENSMGTGPSIPSNTSHKYVQPINDYIRNPKKIRTYLADHPDQYINKGLIFNYDATIHSTWQIYYNKLKGKKPKLSKEQRWTNSLNLTINDLRNSVIGKKDYDLYAQTRIMASYGFLQVTHFNATDESLFGFTKTSSTQPPEYLNDQAYNFTAYSEKMIKRLKILIGDDLPSFNWNDGYEKTWLNVLSTYNKGEKGYQDAVIANSQSFLPRSGE